jgi:hypothetical protein
MALTILVYWKNGLRPFFGHRLRCRRQKAWFLPAAPERALGAVFRTSALLPPAKSVVFAGCTGACIGGRFSDIGLVAAGKKRGFCRLCRGVHWGPFFGHRLCCRRQKGVA